MLGPPGDVLRELLTDNRTEKERRRDNLVSNFWMAVFILTAVITFGFAIVGIFTVFT